MIRRYHGSSLFTCLFSTVPTVKEQNARWAAVEDPQRAQGSLAPDTSDRGVAAPTSLVNLPFELVEVIFTLVHQDLPKMPSPFQLLHVSRRWRELAQSMPVLWQDTCITRVPYGCDSTSTLGRTYHYLPTRKQSSNQLYVLGRCAELSNGSLKNLDMEITNWSHPRNKALWRTFGYHLKKSKSSLESLKVKLVSTSTRLVYSRRRSYDCGFISLMMQCPLLVELQLGLSQTLLGLDTATLPREPPKLASTTPLRKPSQTPVGPDATTLPPEELVKSVATLSPQMPSQTLRDTDTTTLPPRELVKSASMPSPRRSSQTLLGPNTAMQPRHFVKWALTPSFRRLTLDCHGEVPGGDSPGRSKFLHRSSQLHTLTLQDLRSIGNERSFIVALLDSCARTLVNLDISGCVNPLVELRRLTEVDSLPQLRSFRYMATPCHVQYVHFPRMTRPDDLDGLTFPQLEILEAPLDVIIAFPAVPPHLILRLDDQSQCAEDCKSFVEWLLAPQHERDHALRSLTMSLSFQPKEEDLSSIIETLTPSCAGTVTCPNLTEIKLMIRAGVDAQEAAATSSVCLSAADSESCRMGTHVQRLLWTRVHGAGTSQSLARS